MDIRDCERGARESDSANGGCDGSTPEKRQSHSLSPLPAFWHRHLRPAVVRASELGRSSNLYREKSRHPSPWRPLSRRRVAAHAVEEEREEAVGERVGICVGRQPRVRPVRRRQHEQGRRAVVQIRAESAGVPALAEQPAYPLFVAAALRQELERALALEVAPLAGEYGRDVQLLGHHPQVGAEREPDPLGHRCALRNGVQRGVERLRAFPCRLVQEILLGVDVRVERALLDPHRLGQVADRGAVVALFREQAGGSSCQLGTSRHGKLTLTIVRLGGDQMDDTEFLEYVQGGGQVETGDWMPDEYRAKLIKFIEMHGNSELMGVLPEREWILRAPTLQRKLALTAKVQDEVGHSQLIYRVVEDLGKPREQCLEDLVSGKTKFHNVFHYPTKTWGDVGVIAWLVDAAAIISQKALLKCSYAPYARIMKKI